MSHVYAMVLRQFAGPFAACGSYLRKSAFICGWFGCVRRCRRLRYAAIGCIRVRVISVVVGNHEIRTDRVRYA